jgi:hypothetical protein
MMGWVVLVNGWVSWGMWRFIKGPVKGVSDGEASV